jgi:hypothetical protein
VKRTRALHHLDTLVAACADMATRPASLFPLRVTALYAAGEVLSPVDEVDPLLVALAVDLPVDEVPWLTEPRGAQHWGSAVRLPQLPVEVRWRSAHAPVDNHVLDRPVLLWSLEGGGAPLSPLPPRPAVPADRAQRLDDELAVSRRALARSTATYAEKRWQPGRLEPVADALWRVAEGYLDLMAATGR